MENNANNELILCCAADRKKSFSVCTCQYLPNTDVSFICEMEVKKNGGRGGSVRERRTRVGDG